MLSALRRTWRSGEAISPGESTASRHLVEQRLKGVMVLTVDQRDLDRGCGSRSPL